MEQSPKNAQTSYQVERVINSRREQLIDTYPELVDTIESCIEPMSEYYYQQLPSFPHEDIDKMVNQAVLYGAYNMYAETPLQWLADDALDKLAEIYEVAADPEDALETPYIYREVDRALACAAIEHLEHEGQLRFNETDATSQEALYAYAASFRDKPELIAASMKLSGLIAQQLERVDYDDAFKPLVRQIDGNPLILTAQRLFHDTANKAYTSAKERYGALHNLCAHFNEIPLFADYFKMGSILTVCSGNEVIITTKNQREQRSQILPHTTVIEGTVDSDTFFEINVDASQPNSEPRLCLALDGENGLISYSPDDPSEVFTFHPAAVVLVPLNDSNRSIFVTP